jgi:hypothetical protein
MRVVQVMDEGAAARLIEAVVAADRGDRCVVLLEQEVDRMLGQK